MSNKNPGLYIVGSDTPYRSLTLSDCGTDASLVKALITQSNTECVLPSGVTSIGYHAFYGCRSLTSVTIPDSVISIGEGAFQGSKLASITIPNSVTSIGRIAFSCCNLTSIIIPDSVTSIGLGAFEGCTRLTSITIPDSVTDIGAGAFESCTGLTSITIGNSVTSIGLSAFYDCYRLTSITCKATTPPTLGSDAIPDNVTSIQVPKNSVETYKAAAEWSNFTSIITQIPNPQIKHIKIGETTYDVVDDSAYHGVVDNNNQKIKSVNGSTVVTFDADDEVALTAGTNVTLTGDAANKKITIAATDTTYNNATTSAAGLMSSADKIKLNGIAAGAQVNQNAFSNIVVGDTTIAADSKTDSVTFVAGSNITLTPDATNDKLTIAATDTTYNNATTSAAGLMSATDKTKLNGIAENANNYVLPAATSSALGGVKVEFNEGVLTIKVN